MSANTDPIDIPALTEPINAMMSWSRDAPKMLTAAIEGRPSVPEVPLNEDQSHALSRKGVIGISAIGLDFYTPRFTLEPSPDESQFEDSQLDISEAVPLRGSVSLWGPAMPGDPSSLPEPRDVLFAGEVGTLRISLQPTGKAIAVITGARVATTGGDTRGNLEITCPASAGAPVDLALPLNIAEGREPGFLPLVLKIDCTIEDEELTVTHELTVGVARLVDFGIETKQTGGGQGARHKMTLTADMPQGFQETVTAVMDVTFDVTGQGTVPISMQLQSMSAKMALPSGYLLASHLLPTNLLILASFGSIVRDIAKRVFQTATAAIMASLATAGVAATKVLIAAAAQALGPAVGIPVTLVLYTPTIETWFAGAAITILGASGWVVNGELFDLIF